MKKDATLSMRFNTRDVDPCRQKNHQSSCTAHGLSVTLPCPNHKSGTDAASSQCWPFLYPLFSVNNTTAPCRVAETPRKPRFYELRQHVAQFLFCLNHKVMKSIIIPDAHGIKSITPTEKGGTL